MSDSYPNFSTHKAIPPPPANGALVANPPASGHYLVVAWDLDTTGRRLIDEICHIGK